MELSNAIGDLGIEPAEATAEERYAVREAVTSLVLMLTPYSPHVAEELYAVLAGNEDGILANGARFPVPDLDLAAADEIEIPVQVNGKLRARVMAAPGTPNAELEVMVLANEKVQEFTDGREIVKVVVIPNRLVNIVIKI